MSRLGGHLRVRPSLSTRVVILAAVVLNGLYVASLVLVARPESGYLTFWDGWLYFAATLLPVVLLVMRARSEPLHRTAWILIGAGVAMTWVADLIYQVHDQNLGEWGFPTVSDIAYLAPYPLWAAGIVVLAFGNLPSVARSTTLDGFILGLTIGALAVIQWFAPIFEQSGSAADVTAGISFAVLDLVLIVVAVAALAPSRYRPAPALLGFVVAAAVFGLGDIIYLNRLTDETYVQGTWVDAWWAVGTLMFGLAAWLPAGEPRRSSDQEPVRSSALGAVATVAALGSLGIVVVGLVWGVPHAIPGLAAAMAVVVLALALVRVLWTVRELKAINESFRQARTDDLTGLRNRRGFMEDVDRVLRDHRGEVSVVMIDLNGFKEVNDSLGHPAGDHLLAVVAGRMARAVPGTLDLARLGGDEFGIAVPSVIDGGVDLARRLLGTLDEPVELEGLSVRVSASIGVAAGNGTTRQELIRMADVAMYDAKRQGIGYARYSEQTDPHGRDRIQLLDDLCRAIDDQAFHLYLQPVVDVATADIVGMECLIRWNHPSRGHLLPDEFIPLAERVGLIPQITRVVLDQAAHHLVQVHEAGLDLAVSVNISAKDLVDEELPRFVESAFAAAGAPLDRLTLEITETAVTSDPGRSLRTLQALRARGVRIAIDDFGVGYSSLTQLLELPVDELKLDKSFLIPVEHDRRAQAIVRSTVELCRTLGIGLVAEGVETESAMAFVRSRGVARAQGFHLGVPMPLAEFVAYARQAGERLPGRSGSGR